MLENLKKLLEYCEENIDLAERKAAIERQKKCYRFEKLDHPCVDFGFPHSASQFKRGYSREEIHEDMEKMMYNEIRSRLSLLESRNSGVPMIRADYGIGCLPSIFGVESIIVDGNRPWVKHVGKEGVKQILAKGMPDYRNGFGQRMIDTYQFYAQVLADYPKCREAIKFYHPDFQGPFDVAHLMYGSDIYMDLYDEPELIHELLQLVTATYIDCMKKIKPYLNDEEDGYCYHWGQLYPGSVVVRNDTAVNLSPDMYAEFVAPYDSEVLRAFGTGSVHFCGRADQWIFDMVKCKDIAGFNFGWMEKVVFGQTYLDFLKPAFTDQKRPIIGYRLTEEEFKTVDLDTYGTGISFTVSAPTKQAAIELAKLRGIEL